MEVDWKKRLDNYLENLDKDLKVNKEKRTTERMVADHYKYSKTNAELVRKYVDKLRAMPSQPVDRGLYTAGLRMTQALRHMNNPELSDLTEKDILVLNKSLRESNIVSANDIRKELKRFMKLTDKKKYYELIESEYMKSARRKKNAKKVVDSSKFWTDTDCQQYISECQRKSNKLLAWATLLISSGCRPHEILALKRKDVEYDGNFLTIRVPEGTKTGSRAVVLKGSEANGIWSYLQPRFEEISDDDDSVVDYTYAGIHSAHRRVLQKMNFSKEKYWHPYGLRKMRVTRFYSENPGQAHAQVGHTPGSPVQRHYVAVDENQLKGKQLFSLATRTCPNPGCSIENKPTENVCVQCGSPLDEEKFKAIFEKQAEKLVEAQLERFKAEFSLKKIELANSEV